VYLQSMLVITLKKRLKCYEMSEKFLIANLQLGASVKAFKNRSVSDRVRT